MVSKRKNESEKEFQIRRRIYCREYMRNYIHTPKAKLARKLYQGLWKQKYKLLIEQKLGIKCVICGLTKHLVYHEIHGKLHSNSLAFVFGHIEDFIPLCRRCHVTLHNLYELKRQDKMESLVKLLNKLSVNHKF